MKPWEKYQNTSTEEGPWSKYAQQQPQGEAQASQIPEQQVAQPQQPSLISQLLRSVMKNTGIEQMGTAGALQDKMPSVNPNESMQQYQQRVNQILQPREQQIAGQGVMKQLDLPINAALAVEGGAIAKPIIGGVSKVLKPILRWEGELQQARKSKEALDTVRTTLGKAKEIALQEVKDIPAELNWSGNVSKKVVDAIQNPIYKVEFTNEGGVVNTVGNLDKVKTALSDILTNKDFVEASNMEKRQIMQFAGRVRDTMLKATKDAGRPELGKSLSDYHNFMEKYNIINDKLIDKYGNAMGNKLKEAFKWSTEPALKEAWKEVSKASPEIKSVMNSMNNRELIKGLLKITGVAAAGTGAVKVFHQ